MPQSPEPTVESYSAGSICTRRRLCRCPPATAVSPSPCASSLPAVPRRWLTPAGGCGTSGSWDAGQCQDGLHCGGLPAGERAVRAAPISGIGMGKEGVFVVATAAGRLWDCRKDTCAEWPGV
eukprot:TRINITY_DN12413_c0_g1_i6.p4 TRINITY_DN12413_c0_g1~~TRINITY_DN12413_c0_g1_i6.p4  ORF type:complete len:122 (+),score=12.57 TRINITY_DN12413_c0_g1_i6:82-447(+)